MEQPSPCATTTEPALLSLGAATAEPGVQQLLQTLVAYSLRSATGKVSSLEALTTVTKLTATREKPVRSEDPTWIKIN